MRPPVPGAKTPLLYATRRGDLAVTQLLVDAGADLELADADGVTPLLNAILNASIAVARGAIGEHGHLAVARYLVERGADVNAADWYGETPLWAAVDIRNLDVNGPQRDNGIDRAARAQPHHAVARAQRGSQCAHPRVPARATLLDAPRLAVMGRLHGPNSIPAGRARGRRNRHAPAARARRRSRHRDGRGHDAAHGGGRHELGLQSDVRRRARGIVRSSRACAFVGQRRERDEFDGLGGDPRRRQSRLERHRRVPRGARRQAGHGRSAGRTPLVWAEGVFLATHPPQRKPETVALLERLLQ